MYDSYPISIKREFPFWWWHVVGMRRYGYTLTEKGARKQAARAVLAIGSSRRGFERWSPDDATKVLND